MYIYIERDVICLCRWCTEVCDLTGSTQFDLVRQYTWQGDLVIAKFASGQEHFYQPATRAEPRTLGQQRVMLPNSVESSRPRLTPQFWFIQFGKKKEFHELRGSKNCAWILNRRKFEFWPCKSGNLGSRFPSIVGFCRYVRRTGANFFPTTRNV